MTSERITELEAKVAVLQQAIGEIYAVANHEHATLADVVPVIIKATKALEGDVNLLTDRQRIAKLEADLKYVNESYDHALCTANQKKQERDEALAQSAVLLREVEAGRALADEWRSLLRASDPRRSYADWTEQCAKASRLLDAYDAARAGGKRRRR